MKVALVTDDGMSVSPHFGRASAYAVITVEDGVIVAHDLRVKSAPHSQDAGGRTETDERHDGPAAQARHDQMIAPIMDCACVVARGMGRGAYDRIAAAGIRPIVTEERDIDAAALACAAGRLANLVERLH